MKNNRKMGKLKYIKIKIKINQKLRIDCGNYLQQVGPHRWVAHREANQSWWGRKEKSKIAEDKKWEKINDLMLWFTPATLGDALYFFFYFYFLEMPFKNDTITPNGGQIAER